MTKIDVWDVDKKKIIYSFKLPGLCNWLQNAELSKKPFMLFAIYDPNKRMTNYHALDLDGDRYEIGIVFSSKYKN